MYKLSNRGLCVFSFLLALTVLPALGQRPAASPTPPTASLATITTGRAPIIIVPGLTGSELINARTGESVWFRKGRAKDDDLRLPISADLARNRDNLVPRDIIRSVKFLSFLPETEIYERLTEALVRRGYREAKWNTATSKDATDTFFVFPYDWRRDNVESGRRLTRQVEALKRRLGKPGLKFNVIAHSMGGLVARYSAMYGNTELPVSNPRPTWAGRNLYDKIFLVGTPNEGSVLAINALLNGFSYLGGGINLPFIQNITRFDVFTLPSIYQLLPHEGSLVAYDDDLKPISLDIYDPSVWDKYDWAIWKDDDFKKKLTPLEQRNARAFFLSALSRAKRFQTALNANNSEKVPVSFFLIGADCKDTLSGLVLTRDEKKGRWETRIKADGFTNVKGVKITDEQLKPLLYSMGDSVVPKRSLGAQTLSASGRKILPVTAELFQCEGHSKLVTNPSIQDKLFVLLTDGALDKLED